MNLPPFSSLRYPFFERISRGAAFTAKPLLVILTNTLQLFNRLKAHTPQKPENCAVITDLQAH